MAALMDNGSVVQWAVDWGLLQAERSGNDMVALKDSLKVALRDSQKDEIEVDEMAQKQEQLSVACLV